MIPEKSAYMDDETSAKVVKVVAPGIKKLRRGILFCVLSVLLCIYLTLHLCPSKFYANFYLISLSGGNYSHTMASNLM